MSKATKTCTLETWRADQLLEALELAIDQIEEQTSAADDAGDVDEEDRLIEKRREFEGVRRELKVACGVAKDFDEHFKCEGETELHGAKQFEWDDVKDRDERYVWTVTDEDGELCISPGFHYVNRQHYYVSLKPWTDDDLLTEWILT